MRKMIIPRSEADTFGVTLALEEAEQTGFISREGKYWITRRAGINSSKLLVGESLFTTTSDGGVIEIKLADKEPENQETANDE